MSGSRGEANFVWKCKNCKVSRIRFCNMRRDLLRHFDSTQRESSVIIVLAAAVSALANSQDQTNACGTPCNIPLRTEPGAPAQGRAKEISQPVWPFVIFLFVPGPQYLDRVVCKPGAGGKTAAKGQNPSGGGGATAKKGKGNCIRKGKQ